MARWFPKVEPPEHLTKQERIGSTVMLVISGLIFGAAWAVAMLGFDFEHPMLAKYPSDLRIPLTAAFFVGLFGLGVAIQLVLMAFHIWLRPVVNRSNLWYLVFVFEVPLGLGFFGIALFSPIGVLR